MTKLFISYQDDQILFYHVSENDKMYRSHKISGTYYEIKLLEKIKSLNLKGTYIDAGANLGNHTVFFDKYTLCDKVISIEPVKKTYDILKLNVNTHTNNVITFNELLSDKNDAFQMSVFNEMNVGSSKIQKKDPKGIKSKTLDELIYLPFVDDISLIKIDVEGHEKEVLKGALNIVRDNRPVIIAELKNRTLFNEFYSILKPFKYKCDMKNYAHSPTYIFTN